MKNLKNIALVGFLFLCIACEKEEIDFTQEQILKENEDTNSLTGRRAPSFQQIRIPCATKDEPSNNISLQRGTELYYEELANSFLNLCTRRTMPLANIRIKFHLVRKDDGTGGMQLSDFESITNRLYNAFISSKKNENVVYPFPYNQPMNRSIEGLIWFNEHFNSSLGHYAYDYDYINSTKLYYNKVNPDEGMDEFNELITIQNDPNALNIYVVGHLEVGVNTYADGWAAGIGSNAVVVSLLGNAHTSSTLTHEIGHALSLYHPFKDYEELCFDENFSDTTGDFIFDTALDIRIKSPQIDPATCSLAGEIKTDIPCHTIGPNPTDLYHTLTNFMSYGPEECRGDNGTFTPMQMLKMYHYARDTNMASLQYPPNHPCDVLPE